MRSVKVGTIVAALACLLLGSTMDAKATTGQLQQPLRVTQMYAVHGQSVVYVAFQNGAMPGCYGGAGGYLYTSNSFFKEVYAQLLTMIATGGLRAVVVYTINTPGGTNWGDCTIDGLYLQLE